ncbi:CDP-glycerol glycerophosphotransferase family protein [Legionella tunisiensis]|uniref:CDP-glycerol glycerophosphotransferase family protein n=1 Tax=Legionella tunisiensis TaxID=1034944 RepID=UPI0002D5B290|nr:CDP-glycerol glycerophosphotransferase family protein [Legionella tunisiensis]
MKFIRYLNNLIRLFQLSKAHRQVVFYSEGRNYWTHLESLVNELLNTTEINICYISSGSDDPGLNLKHPRYNAFITDEGFFRNWLFANIETDVLIMTMPDLHQFQVKRSKYPVHYIYVQHSLVSLHMAYRKGAFDYFDTIFCAGPHHYDEIRAMETQYNLPGKNLVKYGYPRLDSIKAEYKNSLKELKRDKNTLHALLAPSWGSYGTIESGLGLKIVDSLIMKNIKVTLRPHPQTVKFARKK